MCMALDQNFYAVLGVKRAATRDEIRDAFKSLASQYHPDRNNDEDAARRFKEISEAYFVLSDPAQRHLYDILGPDKYDDPPRDLVSQAEPGGGEPRDGEGGTKERRRRGSTRTRRGWPS